MLPTSSPLFHAVWTQRHTYLMRRMGSTLELVGPIVWDYSSRCLPCLLWTHRGHLTCIVFLHVEDVETDWVSIVVAAEHRLHQLMAADLDLTRGERNGYRLGKRERRIR